MGFIPRPLGRNKDSNPFGYPVACGGVVHLNHYYLPWDLEEEIEKFVEYYNNERYHESLDNVPPAAVFFGWAKRRLNEREEIKQKTLERRRKINLKNYYKKGHLKRAFQGETVS